MWIIFVIIAIFAFLAFCGFLSEKRDKGKSSTQLDSIKSEHNITLSFVSQGGCLAFCDTENKIYNYQNALSKLEVIDYSSIIKLEKNQYINGFSFWTLNPTYTEYISGDVGVDNLASLKEKLSKILESNIARTKLEYESITVIPNNAAQVTIKDFSGNSNSFPNTMKGMGAVHIWKNDNNLYLLSKFNFLDYKLRPNIYIYKLVSIEKNSIVSIAQEGSVHYTTEISGGGGGGSSVKGAIIGGVIAGEAGAIIASRKATDPITSTTKQIDDRATKIKILDKNNNFVEITLDYNNYYIISKMIAE